METSPPRQPSMPHNLQLTFSFDLPKVENKENSKPILESPRPEGTRESSTAGRPEPPGEERTADANPFASPNTPKTPDHATPPATTTVTVRRSALIRGRRLDRDLTAKCRSLLEGIGMPDLARLVHVLWNSRLQTTAGMADGRKQEITLNPKLLDLEPSELETTMRHELAHLVAFHRADGRRIQAHGAEWRRACVELGIPNEKRCHDLPFKGRRHRPKFAYQCKHCLTVYPRTRRLRKYSACYSCCQEHNRGRYSNKFILKEVPLEMLPSQEAD